MSNYRKLTFLFICIFIISLVGATSLGTFKQNNCFELIQTCDTCTYNNVSNVVTPNSSEFLLNVEMEQDDTFYNLSFCNTEQIGSYVVNGFGDLDGTKTIWQYEFEITRTGSPFGQDKALVYIALLALLCVLFVLNLFGIAKLPKGNDTNEDGFMVSINNLKYFRPVLIGFAWALLMVVFFVASNIAYGFLSSDLMGNIFFMLFRFMMLFSFPAILLFFIHIFLMAFRDKEFKKLLERGIAIEEGGRF